ncbi:MAG: radical SAM protein [Gammaproteobacteria bacterium]|jgi:wyosine [tRNA(Phe)-imidazoG37] synthetase (radical SAM superfamily)
MAIAFGPVPSRRLGRSMGINNIPPKSCSYSCLYCQVGTTHGQIINPRVFYAPETVFQVVSRQLEKIRDNNEAVDYLTFVPDGEPTLDINLGRAIDLLRPLGVPVAVITNASLLWKKDVRAALGKADWVSLKVDSVNSAVWKKLNRPHHALDIDDVMEGIRRFALEYQGELVTETMLINGINDTDRDLKAVAGFLVDTGISINYLSIPTRPTAESGLHAPDEATLNRCYQTMAAVLPRVEHLTGYEGDAFASSGDAGKDLLSITAVHPMRESAVDALLKRANADWTVVEELIANNDLKQVDYQGEHFFVRRFHAGV